MASSTSRPPSGGSSVCGKIGPSRSDFSDGSSRTPTPAKAFFQDDGFVTFSCSFYWKKAGNQASAFSHPVKGISSWPQDL